MIALGKHKLLASYSASIKAAVKNNCALHDYLTLRLVGGKLTFTDDLPAISVQNKVQYNQMSLAPNHVLKTSRSKFNSPGVSEVETAPQLHSSEVKTALKLHSSEVETALQLHFLLWMWSGSV